jgi:hypothetical protein
MSARRRYAGNNLPSSPSSVLSDLAPARNSGWLLGLQRADPSTPLDECGVLLWLWTHCAVLDQELQERSWGTPHSIWRPRMNPIAPRTRSLSRGHYPGMGYPGDPTSRRRRRPRGRRGSAALTPGAARDCSGLVAGDAAASPYGWTRMGASAEQIHCRPVNERQVGALPFTASSSGG